MGTDRIRPLDLEVVRVNGYSPHTNPYTGRQTAMEAVGTDRVRVPPQGPSRVWGTLPEKPWNGAGDGGAGRVGSQGTGFPALRSLWQP